MKKVINGKTYNTDTSFELKKFKKSTMVVPDIELKIIKFLYETRTGNYFIFKIKHFIDHKHPIMNGTEESIEPLTKNEAMRILYGE